MHTNLSNYSDVTLIDLHTHPSLKTYLFNKRLYKKHRSTGKWNPFGMRVDLPKIKKGGVDAILSTVYLPEKKMIDDCIFLKLLTCLPVRKFRRLRKGNPFCVSMEILNTFEQAVCKAQEKGWAVEIARSASALERIIYENKIAVVHSIEGAHSLDGRMENLHTFFDRGVSLLTLAHFYENEVTQTVGGIPHNKKFLGCFKNEREQQGGLSPFGHEVVEEMIRIGMLIDLTHCTIKGRQEVYERNKKQRPLLITHTGVHEMNPVSMNPSDDEIKTVADCGGAVGVIFMNYWLHPEEQKNGLDLIIDTIKHLRTVGGIDSVAIGSDLDGFTDPPDDIKDLSRMPVLIQRLSGEGFTTEEIEKIMGQNALRVIKEGWGQA